MCSGWSRDIGGATQGQIGTRYEGGDRRDCQCVGDCGCRREGLVIVQQCCCDGQTPLLVW